MEPPLLPRTTSPRPSGRIALPADSPIPIPGPMPPPIFSQGYPLARPPFPNIYSSFGFNPRPEPSSIKPTSTSALGFPPGNSKTTELAYQESAIPHNIQNLTLSGQRKENAITTMILQHQTASKILMRPSLQP
jgi:hypothetical protein